MSFSCLPNLNDPRVQLLKQATVTGMPARSRDSVARTQSTMSKHPPRFSELSKDDKKGMKAPPPLTAPCLDSMEELLAAPLSVDIATVFDEDEEGEEGVYTRAEPDGGGRVAAQSVGAFTRRAYVAQGNYRIGWMIDSESVDCVRCRRRFGALVRRHHCRGCGKYLTPLICLLAYR